MIMLVITLPNGFRYVGGRDMPFETLLESYVKYPNNDESPATDAWDTTTQPMTDRPRRFYLVEHRHTRRTIETYIARRHRR